MDDKDLQELQKNGDEFERWLEETGQLEPPDDGKMDEMEREYMAGGMLPGPFAFGGFLGGVDLTRDVVPAAPEPEKEKPVERVKDESRGKRDDVRERRLRGIASMGPDAGGHGGIGLED